MATIKCKMCGGDLILDEETTVAECELCGSRQTVPLLDNEKKVNLFSRANRLRANNEFDKARSVYESIAADFPDEAETYWGMVLCKYGIEYVDDPETGKKAPIIHRTCQDVVLDDSNFELVMEYSDQSSRRVYREEAKQIEDIRKRNIELAKKEQPHDVFLCYKEADEKGNRTEDSTIAQEVYDLLVESGYRVFFSRVSLKDKPVSECEPSIFAALNSAKIMLAFGTDYDCYNDVWVKNDWSRYLQMIAKGGDKILIPCYKDLDAYDMPKEFEKLKSQDLGKSGAVQELVGIVKMLLPRQDRRADARRTEEKKAEEKKPDAKKPADKKADEKKPDARKAEGKKPEESKAGERKDEKSAQTKAAVAEAQKPEPENVNIVEDKHVIDIKSVKADPRLAEIREKLKAAQALLATGPSHTIGVNGNGTVSTTQYVGDYSLYKQCNTSEWSDIAAVTSGDGFLIGLKSNGTAVATGYIIWLNNITNWTDIASVAAGTEHVLGLKADGTVMADGKNNFNDCRVAKWANIVAIAARETYSLGLKADGTLEVAGQNNTGACDVSNWIDVVAVSAGVGHSLGLRADGSVLATRYTETDYCGQCDVNDWKNVVAVAAGGRHSLGLLADGTVVATGCNDQGQCNVSNWKNIVAIVAGASCSLGMKSDGTILAVGQNDAAQLDVAGWKLFDKFENLEKKRQKEVERIKQAKQAAEQRKREAQMAEEQRRKDENERKRQKLTQQVEEAQRKLTALEFEKVNLKGIFANKRRKEVEEEIAAMNQTLPNLQKELEAIKD